MRKKSHATLANHISRRMQKEKTRKATFWIGNLLPDVSPSFITIRHKIEETESIVRRQIRLAKISPDGSMMEAVHAGMAVHYIADWFTYPHNSCCPYKFGDHNRYEDKLKAALRFYIRSGMEKKDRAEQCDLSSLEEIMGYVKKMHKKYLSEPHGIGQDCRYITDVCTQAARGIMRHSRHA